MIQFAHARDNIVYFHSISNRKPPGYGDHHSNNFAFKMFLNIEHKKDFVVWKDLWVFGTMVYELMGVDIELVCCVKKFVVISGRGYQKQWQTAFKEF